MGWVAEEFFTDAKVISLCHAIESEDLKLMRQLIDTGADVNAIGEGGMTPLLWAFPDNKIENRLLSLPLQPSVCYEHLLVAGTKKPA